MSLAATRWAISQGTGRDGIGSSAKLLLLLLADHADDDGRCWPSIARLADLGCMSERTARDGVRELEGKGLVASTQRSGAPTLYVLPLDTPAKSAPVQEQATPAKSAGEGGEYCRGGGRNLPATPAKSAPEPTKEPTIEPKKEGEASQAAPPPPKPDPRGSRLPGEWQPSSDDVAYATERGLDPSATAESFRDFWHAKAGQGGRKLDWPATWRTWCRRDAERRPQARAGPSPRSDEAVLRAAGLWPDPVEASPQRSLQGLLR